MGIKFAVAPGTILVCDYSRGGFQPPEMIKRRPAIVVSPRLRHRDGLCAVVPISSQPNARECDYVVRLEFDPCLPAPFSNAVGWAKCDMLATVGFDRLDLFRTGRDQFGKRKYLHPMLTVEDLKRVRIGILYGLGLVHLTLTPE